MKKDFYRASPHVGMQEDQIHQIKVNVKKKEWQCQICNGIFFNKATLSKHLKEEEA